MATRLSLKIGTKVRLENYNEIIGIAGVGGIGSNVAKILGQSGVSNLKIIDFDHVEFSNLNRQFYFASQINKPKVDMLKDNLKKIIPDVRIIKEMKRLTESNLIPSFSECEIIVEGLDTKKDKIMLLETLQGKKSLIVSASGIAGNQMETVKVKKLGKSCYIIGDFYSDVNSFDIFPPKVFYIASIMASIVLNYINKVEK